jgi:fibronectin-binding autotransporter adhesin
MYKESLFLTKTNSMKTIKLSFHKKISVLLIGILLTSASVFGATFTAVTSGNWSASTTWGVAAPPFNLTTDQVVIPVGVDVAMDGNVTVNGALASVNVLGMLSSATTSLTVTTLGTVTGTGSIDVGSVNINTGAVVAFTGSLAASTITASALAIQIAADMTVNQTLNLTAGTLSVAAGGSLSLASDATIAISGGSLALNGGSIGLLGIYNVSYTGGSAIAGIELTGSGLNNVTIAVNAGSSVALTTDLFIDGTLSLSSGTLALSGNDLTITGDVFVGGSGTITSSVPGSDININATGGISGSLNFSTGANIVNNLSVSVGMGNQAHIGGNITVNGGLQLTSGTLNFSNAGLTINGTVTGGGSLSGNASSDITINTTGGIPAGISFITGGQVINNFTINVGAGNAVSLNTGLTVAGNLGLMGGSVLDISGHSLTLGGSISGTGSFSANAGSSLTLNTSGSVATPITISGGTIGVFVVNAGTGNTVSLGGNLTVAGTLSLQSGTLVLNGYDITIANNIAVGGTGTISSTAASDITINTSLSPAGSISFNAGGNTVNNFTVNISSGGSVAIGSDATISGTLNLTNGSVNIGSYGLHIAAGGSISGASSSSYVMTGMNGFLAMQLTAGGSGSVNFPVGTTVQFSPASIQLNSGSASGEVGVNVMGNVLAQGTTGGDISATQALVDATWHITSNITAGLNMNMEVMWTAGMEVNAFNRADAYISHFTGGTWDVTAAGSASASGSGMFSLQRNNVTSLSPFAVFGETGVSAIKEIPEVQFAVYPNPASKQITVQNTSASLDVLNVDVTNVIGQVVASYKLTDTTLDIPLSSLHSGNYFIRLYNDRINTVKKFTKM